jgi:hypothetical protein
MADVVRVNGNLFSYGSIIAKVLGERYRGFTSISVADKRERVHGYGMGKHHAPLGRSRGKYIVEPSKVTGWKHSVQALRATLAAQSPDGISYGDVEFDFVVQYIEPSLDPITIELERCVWTANNASDEENPDPLKEDFEVLPMMIRRNGLVLFDASEGAP